MVIETEPRAKLTVIREPVKKGMPEISQFKLPDGGIIRASRKQADALDLVFRTDKAGVLVPISRDDIMTLCPSDFEQTSRGYFARLISSCKIPLEKAGWKIVNEGHKGGHKPQNGTWKPVKIEPGTNPNNITEFTQNDAEKALEEEERMKNFRIAITRKILVAISKNKFDDLEQSPAKFLRKIINSADESNPTLPPDEIDNLRAFILDSVRQTIIKVGETDKAMLSDSERRIFNALESIVNDERRDGNITKRMENMMDSVENHFSGN